MKEISGIRETGGEIGYSNMAVGGRRGSIDKRGGESLRQSGKSPFWFWTEEVN